MHRLDSRLGKAATFYKISRQGGQRLSRFTDKLTTGNNLVLLQKEIN